MGRIIILDEDTTNKIAAGEVIERPASVVKELVENSIDAGALNITVEIANGGISLLKVSDNGHGFMEDDVEIAFERHSTSKIRSAENLNSITTLGFRGEALASIASVSRLQLISKAKGSDYGMELYIEGGRIQKLEKCGTMQGTTISVRDLFYNTPARYKFLKKDSTESRYISDIMSRIALGNPEIAFLLVSGSSEVMRTPGGSDLLSTIFSIYGKETAKGCIPIKGESKAGSISGFVGNPDTARSNRTDQSFYVNGRFVKNTTMTAALDEAYKTFIMKGRYPFAVLNITIDPSIVDVNVHPAKQQVKFSDEQEIFRLVYHAVRNALAPGLQQTAEYQEIDSAPDIGEKTGEQASVYSNHQHYSYGNERNGSGFDAGINSSRFTRIDYNLFNFGIDKSRLNENSIENRIDVRELLDAKIQGQLYSTYILFETGNSIVLIDQHAAHEKIMYEKIKKLYTNNELISQKVLEPIVIDLGFKEAAALNENKELLSRLGFDIEHFGNNSVIIRAVPYDGRNTDIKKALLDLLDCIIENEDSGAEKMTDETLYKLACTSAVKANRVLAESEIRSIIADLCELENPYTCPHGRPTMVKLDREWLEKLFKRIK